MVVILVVSPLFPEIPVAEKETVVALTGKARQAASGSNLINALFITEENNCVENESQGLYLNYYSNVS